MKKLLSVLLIFISISCQNQNTKSIIGEEKAFKPGEKNILESMPSKKSNYKLVFEDDGETGYLYVLVLNNTENPIVDAMHIYNVKNVTDKKVKSHFMIEWTKDGTKGALFINNYCHAIVDFTENGAYNRNGFPPIENDGWVKKGHDWDESKLNLFN